jgi:hypothetical protein
MKTVQDLRSIQSQAILRLNCPGYGQASALSKDGAALLTEYKVIIANPLSVLHLFGGQTDMTKQIDMALNEGLTSFKLADDQLINKLSAQIDNRSQEILQFLGQGGLLIYYLSRPFVLIGSSRFLDNYAWLGGLAPDQSGQSTLGEQTIRHMSTVAHGRNVDKTAEADNNEFSKYFEQPGLEWNTIIRTEFLTEGYITLALAGPKKCIAAQLMVGDCGGRVVFLPAPYSPDFDRTLVDCIYQWHTNNLAKYPDSAAEIVPPDKIVPQEAVPPPPGNTKLKQLFAEQLAPPSQSSPAAPNVVDDKPPATNLNGQEKEEPVANSPIEKMPEKILEGFKQSLPVAAMAVPDVEAALPENKILPGADQDIKNWAITYQLLGIDQILEETETVRAQIMQLERQIASKEETIGFLETAKVPLLSGRGGSLLETCKITLNALGWASKTWGSNPNQLLLNENGQPKALAHISLSKGQVERAQLAGLAESLINYWNEHTYELKGIFIACPFADTAFDQRQSPDFTEMVIEFARHKNVCLLSTLQLLYIYRDIRLGKADAKSIHQAILTCSGCLPGFAE